MSAALPLRGEAAQASCSRFAGGLRRRRSGGRDREDEQRARRGGDRAPGGVEDLALGERDPSAGLHDAADRGERPTGGVHGRR